MSTFQSGNPDFYDWTKIYLPYCDGLFHSGNSQAHFRIHQKKLYLRGHQNTLQAFKFLEEKFDFYNGESIVLAGSSAGAIGVYIYMNYLH